MEKPPPNAAAERWEELLRLPEQDARIEAMRWDWFALLRLIQCAHPQQPRFGYGIRLDQEPVRLGQPAFFHPPATTIADLSLAGPKEPGGVSNPRALSSTGSDDSFQTAWIYSYHLGMFGPHGPLPLHLTEFADQQRRHGNGAFLAFCNVLSHRFLCFFFRAWAEGRKELSLDRPDAVPEEQQRFARQDISRHGEEWWSNFVGTLIGCGLDSQRCNDGIPEHAKLFYAGRLLPTSRNAEGLRSIIEDYFSLISETTDCSAEIIEYQPRKLPIPRSAQWTLGADNDTGRLGWSTLVGESVVDHQSGFRIRIGPLSLRQLDDFLPGTERFDQLHDWVRFYCGETSDPNPEAGLESSWDLQLVLLGSEVPQTVLGPTSRLGYTTWLHSGAPRADVDELVIQPRLKPKSDRRSAVSFTA